MRVMEAAVSPWTDSEDKVIRDLAGVVSAREIASQLPGRSVQAVARRRRALGLDGRLYGAPPHEAKASNLQRDMTIPLPSPGFTATEIKRAFNLENARSTINDMTGRCR